MKFLFAQGENIFAKDENGNTAVISAAINGHYNIVKYLLENMKIDIHSLPENFSSLSSSVLSLNLIGDAMSRIS